MSRTARERLLTSAVALMRSKGVAGTTVADLLEHSGVARRSLYLSFPRGRDELLAEAARQAGAEMSPPLTHGLAAAPDLASAVSGFVGAIRDGLVSSGYSAGCPIVAAALGGTVVSEARDSAGATFTTWMNGVTDALTRRGTPESRARSLAALVVSAVEGAIVVAIATRSAEPLDHVADRLEELVAAELPAQQGG